MNSKSDNIETIIGHEANEIFDKPFDSLLQKYQKRLEESMEGSESVFDSVN